jgi:hypothetical protein
MRSSKTAQHAWGGFTERQTRVPQNEVRLIYIDGQPIFSMPPRINADWFLPPHPTQYDLRAFYGRTYELQRWYLVINLVSCPAEVTLVTALNVDGERKFSPAPTAPVVRPKGQDYF